MTTRTETAFAKINLWLEVLGRRSDGYHELETVMHEIDLADTVQVTPGGDEVTLSISDPNIGSGEENLAIRAVRALEHRCGRSLPCSIEIDKRIPVGGGLGGGSSDAAAVMRALNQLYGLDLAVSELEEVAASFGSDTAFFIRGGTSLCTGRGEIVSPLTGVPDFCILLVMPPVAVPTPFIFSQLQLSGNLRESYDLIGCFGKRGILDLRGRLFNRLESVARAEFGEIDGLLEDLAEWSPMMSGSGSTLFILCGDEGEADHIEGRIGHLDRRGVSLERVASAHR